MSQQQTTGLIGVDESSPKVDFIPQLTSNPAEVSSNKKLPPPPESGTNENKEPLTSVVAFSNNSKLSVTTTAAAAVPTINAQSPYSHTTATANNDLVIEEANNEIAALLLNKKITNEESSKLQNILRENATLKDKIAKLKLLLSRSAKASKDTKNDLEGHKRLLDMSQQEIQRLNVRLENLASRPTHMELLADFETNFDKALLSSTKNNNMINSQSGGEVTTSSSHSNNNDQSANHVVVESSGDNGNVPSMLLTELSQAKSRSEHLEEINAALLNRAAKLEKINEQSLQGKKSDDLKMSNVQLELRMAKMETENASRSIREKAACLVEMQMEIDLVTKSAMCANVRAAEGMQVAKSI